MGQDKIYLNNLQFYANHGLLAEETVLGQRFNIDAILYVDLAPAGKSDNMHDSVSYADVYTVIQHIVENEAPVKLLERLAHNLAATILTDFPLVEAVMIRVTKPDPPIRGIYDNVAVEITRDQTWLLENMKAEEGGAIMVHQALIALGSNIEPKVDHLRNAIQAFRNQDNIQVTAVSSVYETVPRGYADQDNFYNMVLQIETDLAPQTLLAFCQSIETMEKRVRLFKNGPRTIDVDILLIDELTLTYPDLLVPHPRMHERGFVLIPTAEIAGDWVVPGFNGATITDLNANLPQVERDDVRISDAKL